MKTIEETFTNMNKKSTALKGELIMKAQELSDQKAKRLEGVTEKEPLEIMLDNVGPGHIIYPSEDLDN